MFLVLTLQYGDTLPQTFLPVRYRHRVSVFYLFLVHHTVKRPRGRRGIVGRIDRHYTAGSDTGYAMYRYRKVVPAAHPFVREIIYTGHKLSVIDYNNNGGGQIGCISRCSYLIGNDRKGRIYIDYYNTDDLDRISEIIDLVERQEKR